MRLLESSLIWGIPPNLGIFVSTRGFTRDALGRASAAGIRTLVMKGVSDDRLALAVQDVLSAVVFWVARWENTSIIPFLPSVADDLFEVTLPKGMQHSYGELDAIWKLWVSGEIPLELGEHTVKMRFEDGRAAVGTLKVTAHSFIEEYKSKTACLQDVRSGDTVVSSTTTTRRSQASGHVNLQALQTIKDMKNSLKGATIRHDIRVPRLEGPRLFWPPSGKSLNKIKELVETGKPFRFEDVEGLNIMTAWEGPVSPDP